MTLTTTTQLGGPVNYVAQRTLLSNAKARCPYFAGSQPGDILPSHQGSFSVLWRRYENLTPTTSAKTELTGSLSLPTRTATQVSKSDVTATVSKYGDFMYLTEEADLVNVNAQSEKLAEVFGIQAGRSLNRLQRNILEDNLTLIYEGGGSADSSVTAKISRNAIRQAVNTLNRNDAITFTPETTGSKNVGTTPIRMAYLGMCHSDVEEDIRDLSGFIAVEQYAGQIATYPGEFGMVAGVRWISTSEATIDASSGGAPGAGVRSTNGTAVDLYTSVILGKECHGALSLDVELIREQYMAGDMVPGIIMISKAKGSSGVADPLDEVSSVGWKSWHGGAILNSTWGRGIRSGATKLT